MAKQVGFPPQIKYIVGNEACERFSYYGMRSILVVFMVGHLAMAANESQATYHVFAAGCYLLPLLGGYLADRWLGKYKTIMALSIVYCLGHLTLALFESKSGLYWGLALIALGSGGIKPCVSAYVGDQFNEENKGLLQKVFDLFYWSINFGSFFSTLLIPVILTKYGSSWAFGIPGILMGIATLIFWSGRKQYVQIPPTGKNGTPGFMPIATYALAHFSERKPGQSLLDVAKKKYGESAVEGAKAAASIFTVFITVSIFWSLFDQSGSSWVLQAEKMDPMILGFKFEASQLQAANPIMVMVLIPIFSWLIYPMVEKFGIRVTPLRKMSAGMVLAGLSFLVVGLIQAAIDAGGHPSMAWQLVPYLIITCSEVMVSITGLEFAYTQAPPSMKSTIMSFWLVTVFVGNMLAAYVAEVNVFSGAMFFYFYAALMVAVSMVFIVGAARYKVRDFVEDAGPGAEAAAPA